MGQMIFVNLPVRDLTNSRAFFEALGAINEPRFSDDTAACMTFSDSIHVMLLTHDKFMQFSPLPVADANEVAQALFCLSAESREAVDHCIELAAAAGGRADPTPPDEYGVMYGRSVADPDGHCWQVMWMDPAAAQVGAEAIQQAVANAL